MNFSLDAIWWRLTNPHIRALASVLLAPTWWHTGCELSVRELLGEHGFRYLIHLNNHFTTEQLEYLHSPLLGKYAENLLAFWLEHAPHSRLLGRNIQLFDAHHQSVGELDLIAQLNGQIYHIELACKYFGAADDAIEHMAGLNSKDTLLSKINKINNQLTHAQTPYAQMALSKLGITATDIRSVSVLRGMIFNRAGCLQDTRYPANTWTGILINHWQEMDFNHKQFYLLPKNQFLSPARITGSLISDIHAIRPQSGLIAEVVRRPDGYYHEIQRWMLK